MTERQSGSLRTLENEFVSKVPKITPEQKALIAEIEVLPFRPENASAFKITSHIVSLDGEPVRIHELNNFPAVFLRKYFSYVNHERQIYDFNPIKEVVPWLGVMGCLVEKCPDLYEALLEYDRAMLEINQTSAVFQGMLLKAPDDATKQLINEQWQAAMRDLNSRVWPTDKDVATRDIRWSTAYDTMCEIGKIIKPDFDRHELTV